MPAVDYSEKLPPFWGTSRWWTRVGAVLGLLSLIMGLVMAGLLAQHCGPCDLQHQLTNPTLAIEVAGTWDDVLALVGPCESVHCKQPDAKETKETDHWGLQKTICSDKVQALIAEQYWDFGFIVLYWLFFLYLGVINAKFCYWAHHAKLTRAVGRLCGVATIVSSSLGALQDWQENLHILPALRNLTNMSAYTPDMRPFAYHKWQLLFLAIGLASPIFIFWPGRNNKGGVRQSAFSHLLAWGTAILALSTAFTGVAATIFGDDHRLEVATQRLSLVIMASMLTLATAQLWRGGTLAALDKLAKLPVLAFFASLFLSEDDDPQMSDTDPSRML